MDSSRVERFLEFLVIGIALGVTEDVIAVTLATGEPITPRLVGVIVLVAIPFAAFSELIVDHPNFSHLKHAATWVHEKTVKDGKQRIRN